MGKGENAGDKHIWSSALSFSPIPRMFFCPPEDKSQHLKQIKFWSANALILDNLFNPLPDNQILDQSKLKSFAEDILKCI